MANQREHLSRSLRIYQKASIGFVVVSCLLLLAVLYLSVSRATIHVTPVPQEIKQDVELTIVTAPANPGEVAGFVLSDTFSSGKTFEVAGDGGEAVPAKASGVVTLHNETAAPQPLVATTRLLSAEGVLFRLVDAVTIPANGTISAAVAADVAGESGNIEATRFTIPGLLPAKQSTIYATSTDSMRGGLQYVRTLTQEELDASTEALKAEIGMTAVDTLRTRLPVDDFDGSSLLMEATSLESSAKAGDAVGVYTLTATYTVTAVFYDQKSISSHVETALYNELEDGLEIFAIDTKDLAATITNVDLESEKATLSVSITGSTVLSANHAVFRKEGFTGKAPKEVEAILLKESTIEAVEVVFTPFWLKRMPTLKDHIDIKIKKKKVE